MQVTLIPSNELNSDLGVVNCARVSLAKKHTNFEDSDTKLLNYLAKHNHWTPFAHPSFYLSVNWSTVIELYTEKEGLQNFYEAQLHWYKNRNQAGFQHVEHFDGKRYYDYIKGSLIGWIKNLKYLPKRLQGFVLYELYKKYPESVKALTDLQEVDPFTYLHSGLNLNEEYLALHYPEILSVTFLIKVPIAIARQIRTSQVGFSYTDYYVEGESFVYNEVSRRYVNDEPEFYTIDQWRVREGRSIKQGSTGLATEYGQQETRRVEISSIQQGLADYRYLDIKFHIAPEQLRFLLPQSMYTEFYMTGTLSRWLAWLSLRLAKDTQEETRYAASQVASKLTQAYPRYMESALATLQA
jgi:thymidylate synthase (FAD)